MVLDLAEILGRNRDVMIGRKTTGCMIWIWTWRRCRKGRGDGVRCIGKPLVV
jgi:hypothetical protein